jgi:hypothetical protein
MTISEIIQRLRVLNNDLGTPPKQSNTYYTQLIIMAIEDLEPYMGKLAIRDVSYQFRPERDEDGNIQFEADGVTPQIDPEIYYDPETPDANSPQSILVNGGLRVAAGHTTGTIQTADYTDKNGRKMHEPILFLDALVPWDEFKDDQSGRKIQEIAIAFIKIDADVHLTGDGDSVAFDVSFDDRNTWLAEDYDIEFDLENGTTGYIDVSRIPSSHVALKWTISGAAVCKNTTFWRYYISRNQLRHYASDVIELAKKRLLEIKLDWAIKNQNDPTVIGGISAQIAAINQKYGLNKNRGEVEPIAGGRGVCPFPRTREEILVFMTRYETVGSLFNGEVVAIKTDGTIRRA